MRAAYNRPVKSPFGAMLIAISTMFIQLTIVLNLLVNYYLITNVKTQTDRFQGVMGNSALNGCDIEFLTFLVFCVK